MDEQKYLLFDQYLHNEMTDEERNLFESQLSNDMKLKSEFETFREMRFQLENKFAIEEERQAFKTSLKTISQEHFKSSQPKVIQFKPWYLAAAASVAVLLGVFFFSHNSKPNFENFNQPEQAYFTERGNAELPLQQAEIAYNNKNYKEAVLLFEKVLKENKTAEIQYFYGLALLQENQFVKAESVFNELKSGKSVYKNKATWNLALSKLKQKDFNATKEILLTIPSDYENYEEVEKLLKQLD